MKRAIEHTLARVVERPLWAVGRAASLVWFQFGDRHLVTDSRGNTKDVGSYALHLDCPWSWTSSSGEVVADQDSDHAELAELLPTPVICEHIEAGDDGSFRMTFADSSTLEAHADPDPETDEYWRFFEPHRQTPHFVVGPKGVDT